MKKVKFLFFLLFIVAASCQKNSSTQSPELSSQVLAAVNKPTVIEIRQAYSLLSNIDKQALWTAKYDKILSEQKNVLSRDQIQIVNMLRTFLVSNGIEKLKANPALGEAFVKQNFPYFEKHFQKEQLYLMIECAYFNAEFKIIDAKSYLQTFLSNTNSQIRIVNAANSYKANNVPSSDCTCYYSISCSGTTNTCDSRTCTKVQECGLFGTSNCTGKCTFDI